MKFLRFFLCGYPKHEGDKVSVKVKFTFKSEDELNQFLAELRETQE